ncbi:MAG: winged helix-turn-helix domain-containing protein [Acidobacteria bacterium]|nr:winged helix-turn-helix domain-containing protein [Acidobacteriota bacterium]
MATYLDQEFGVALGVRQCQRLFRTLGFRHRKPRPEVAHADPERQRGHKKTPSANGRSGRGVVGPGRSALPPARFSLPDVDSARDSRSGLPASPDSEAPMPNC